MAEMERFDHYMDRCLYHPTDGFYAAGHGVAGRRGGDFITSPEVGPLFGAVIARAIETWWQELGEPSELPVIDAGAGPGGLLRSLELAGPDQAPGASQLWQLIGVDPNGTEGVIPELPLELEGAIVLANELLDNLPFRILERAGADDPAAEGHRWFEAFVVEGEWSKLREQLQPTTFRPTFELDAGQRAPLLERAAHWVDDVLARGAARLVAFDYGTRTTAELAERGGWLRTYRAHVRSSDPYQEPGEWDITTDIAVDQLPPPTAVTTQADFLRTHGIDELVEEGRAYWSEHAARPDLTAMRMRSRINEADALLDPASLGSWLALEWRRA